MSDTTGGEHRDEHRDEPPVGSFDFGVRSTRQRQRPRTSALDWVAMLLAVAAPPIGVLTSVIARIVSSRKYGRTTVVARSAAVVSIVLTVALGAGALVYAEIARQDGVRADLVAESAPLCTMVDEFPGILDDAAFGWPALAATIPESIDLMKVYETRWSTLADGAPKKIRADVSAVAAAAHSIISGIETSRILDGQRNLEKMKAVSAASGIPVWVVEYCG